MNRGNAGKGRPKGAKNKSTGEVRDFARALVERPDYREQLKSRMDAGGLPPAIEAMLWHYAYGKPHESVEVSTPNGGLTIRHVFATEPAR